jgi:predicted RNA binding protein YcfA (HicA-like mRNA interferase family)/predicted RNase H-like HicB family nuclease
MSYHELIKLIEQDGWCLVAVAGSHHQFKHLTKLGKVAISHPKKRLASKTVSSILKQAGLLWGVRPCQEVVIQMAKYIYPAVFDPNECGGYTINFPDLPGCVTEGDTLDDAIRMASEALASHLYGMERDGQSRLELAGTRWRRAIGQAPWRTIPADLRGGAQAGC